MMLKFQHRVIVPTLFMVGTLLVLLASSDAFAPVSPSLAQRTESRGVSSSKLSVFEPSSSMEISAGGIDPTAVLSDVFAGIVGTPLILAVPIVAALSVAGVLAFLIISYANPEVEDDE